MSNPFQAFADACRHEVDTALDAWLRAAALATQAAAEAMRYSLQAGGKRLRPVLALAAADAVSHGHPDTRRLALPAACAIEMIHTYSLVHDDLPAMDDDTLRRGRPTSHVVFGEALAILAGDALLTEAFGLLAREPVVTSPALQERKLQVLALVARAAGAWGMVGGQVLDLAAEDRQRTPLSGPAATARDTAHLDDDVAALRDLHARKTGALIRAATGAGAIMAGADETVRQAVDDYARELGLCFQIVDDILDVDGSAAELGKSAGKDAASGKLTYPALFGLGESRRLAVECGARARAALDAVGIAGHLPAVIDWTLTRRQ